MYRGGRLRLSFPEELDRREVRCTTVEFGAEQKPRREETLKSIEFAPVFSTNILDVHDNMYFRQSVMRIVIII